MNSGADTPTDRAGRPSASPRLDTHVSRVVQAGVPAGAAPTSFWVAARATTATVLRRAAMPTGWAIALLVCAGSAFAVRDVLFPSLGASAARSVWEPRPAPEGTPSPIRSTTSAERPAAAAPADVVVESTADSSSTSVPTDDSVAQATRTDRIGHGAGRTGTVGTVGGSGDNGDSGDSGGSGGAATGDDPSGGASNSSVPSPGTTVAGGRDGDDSTATSTPTAPGVTTTTEATVTTTTDGGVTTTTSAATGDTIADQSGRRGSGSGGGGGSDDSTP